MYFDTTTSMLTGNVSCERPFNTGTFENQAVEVAPDVYEGTSPINLFKGQMSSIWAYGPLRTNETTGNIEFDNFTTHGYAILVLDYNFASFT